MKTYMPISTFKGSLFLTLGFFPLTIHCGQLPKPSVTQLPQGQLTLPEYPHNQNSPLQGDSQPLDPGFGLTSSHDVLAYEGRLIMWSPLATPQHVYAVNQSVVDGRLSKKNALDYLKQSWLPQKSSMAPLESAVQLARDAFQLASSEGLNLPELVDPIRPLFSQYFDNRMTILTSGDTSFTNWVKETKPEITLRWESYCNAKIWELATSSLATLSYPDRPSPQPMCEAYYKQKGYFADAARCRPNSDSQGLPEITAVVSEADRNDPAAYKTYLRCLWVDGVMLTPQYKALFESPNSPTCGATTPTVTKKEIIESWLDASMVTLSVQPIETADDALNQDESHIPLAQILKNKADQKLFSKAVMGGSTFTSGSFSAEAKRLLGQCKDAFRRKSATTPQTLFQSSPQNLLDMIENPNSDNLLRLLPKAPLELSLEANSAVEFLSIGPRLFGTRHQTSSGHDSSIGDYFVNLPKESTLTISNPKDQTTLASPYRSTYISEAVEALSSTAPNIELYWNRLFPEPPAPLPMEELKGLFYQKQIHAQSKKEDLERAEKALFEAKQIFKDTDSNLTTLLEQEQLATTAALRAVNTKDATILFSLFTLKVTRLFDTPLLPYNNIVATDNPQNTLNTPTALEVEWSIDRPQKFVIPPSGLASFSTGPVRSASFDKEANKLSITLEIRSQDDLEAWGLNIAPRSDDELVHSAKEPKQKFSDIPLEMWMGTRLELEFYGQRFGGVLDIFSGNATLYKNETVILRGSMSGDRFDQTRRLLIGSGTRG